MSIRQIVGARILFPLLLSSLAGVSCATGDGAFLLSRLDDAEKADALTAKGIDKFSENLVKKENYSSVNDVKQYFEVALRYDPLNRQAEAYLAKIDAFIVDTVKAKLQEAKGYKAQPKRNEDQTFYLLYSVQKAYELDPGNGEVQKLRNDTAAERERFIKTIIDRSRSLTAKIPGNASFELKKQNYLVALRIVRKALVIEPRHGETNGEKNRLTGLLGVMLNEKLKTSRDLLAKNRLAQAEKDAKACLELNGALENAFDGEVNGLYHDLHLAWARYFIGQKDYPRAKLRAGWALTYRKSQEASDVLKEIQKRQGTADALFAKTEKPGPAATDFTAVLNQIDGLIEDEALAAAQAKVLSARKTTADGAGLAQLEARQQTINVKMKDLYAQALEYYKADDFAKAIELLQAVVLVDSQYEQASNYLEKATAKQKLLQSY